MMQSPMGRMFPAYSPEDLLDRPLNDVEKKFAPSRLYVASSKGIPIPGPRVAIVGSRQASSGGISTTMQIASHLAQVGVVIVSGLAKGIDTAAHKGAIGQGGQTVAVLGTPLDKSYPAENAELQKEIMEKHWALSQFPVGHPTTPKSFVIRNRTMALICDVSIIVEAGESSGSLHQGWEALRLGRPLFIWKKLMEDNSLKWPRKMQDYGAVELRKADQILEMLPSSSGLLQVALP